MPFFNGSKRVNILTMNRLVLPCLCVCIAVPSMASDFGTTGLIDIPTARMSSDGTLTTTAAIQSRTKAYSITYQATPWLEGTFRYTGFNRAIYSMIVTTRQKSGFGRSNLSSSGGYRDKRLGWNRCLGL